MMNHNELEDTRISDAEWQTLRHYFYNAKPSKGRPPKDHRRVINGILWIASTGVAWRSVPSEFGKWGSVYRQFLRWSRSGIWEEIIEDLNHGITNGGGAFDPDEDHELSDQETARLLLKIEKTNKLAARPRASRRITSQHDRINGTAYPSE